MGSVLTFDEPTHTYRVDGRVVPSVTQILSRVFPDVYSGIPEEVLNEKSAIGTAVHRAIELEILGRLDYDTLHESVRPYFDSWLLWWSQLDVKDPTPERKFYSTAGYAGTVDFQGKFGGSKWVIDWKTTSSEMPTHRVQVAGYAFGVNPAARSGCLYLNGDGTVAKLVEHDTAKSLPDWLSVMRVFKLQESMK